MKTNLKLITIALILTLAFIGCSDSDNGGGSTGGGTSGSGGTNSGNNNNNNNGNNNSGNNSSSGTVAGRLYAKAPPILSSDTSVNLSGIAGATVVEQSFNYINANAGTYTLVMHGNVEVAAEYVLEGYTDPPVRHLKTSNVNLTIGNNITLDGNLNGSDTVYVQDNASFIMQNNSKLTGSFLTGVNIVNNSTFTLKDTASISGNLMHAVYIINGSAFTIVNNERKIHPKNSEIHEGKFHPPMIYAAILLSSA